MQIPLSCIAVLGAQTQQILSASGVASSQPYTDRKVSFCAWLLVPEQPEMLIVEDMLADSRCAQSTFLASLVWGGGGGGWWGGGGGWSMDCHVRKLNL